MASGLVSFIYSNCGLTRPSRAKNRRNQRGSLTRLVSNGIARGIRNATKGRLRTLSEPDGHEGNEHNEQPADVDSKSKEPTLRRADNKLMILYLLEKLDIPLSNAQINDFFVQERLLDYFELQQCLAEMVSAGYVEKYVEGNFSRYSITEDGLQTLGYLERRIPNYIRTKISAFANKNRKRIKRSFAVMANHFYDYNTNEYIVKCGVYDDDLTLMELTLSMVTIEQAKHICKNWRSNSSHLYQLFMQQLISPPADEEI